MDNTTNKQIPKRTSELKHKQYIKDCIPTALYQAVCELNLSAIQTRKAIKLLLIILNEARELNNDFDRYIHLPVKYLEKVFTKKYHNDFFNSLKSAEILECNELHQRGSIKTKGISKSYRVNRKFLCSEMSVIYYEDQYSSQSDSLLINPSYNCTTYSTPYNYPLFRKSTILGDLSELQYNVSTLNSSLMDKVESVSAKLLKIDTDIETQCFEIYNRINGLTYRANLSTSLRYARSQSCSVIQDGDKFYIDNISNYLLRKKRNILLSYSLQIYKLRHGIFYAQRNPTNGRLDHNLTVLPKNLIEVIKKENDLVEIDLCNSQFAIHAWWLSKEGYDLSSESTKTYCQLCSEGQLYEDLAIKLNISRDESKKFMMLLAFGSHKKSNKVKRIFRKEFPDVLSQVDSYKMKNGKNLFAVNLQKLEAELFIDNLYPCTKEAGYFCLTRHDSLLVRAKDQEMILSIVGTCLDAIGFSGRFKIS